MSHTTLTTAARTPYRYRGVRRQDDGSSWRAQAACLDAPPDLFFPVGTTGPAVDQIATARELCRTCPVQEACLDWATESRPEFGIWGGLTEDERRRERRRRGASQRS